VGTWLGPADLATVDALIMAGVASSRSEVIRWALGRIRENPVYTQLEERVRQTGELRNRL
jgi:Arc/MetJ-type ribon-helix-helix transcriptional regulator